jgi:two-component system sensor histidine kinase AlgZ
MSTAYATLTGYALILSLTLIFSIIGEWTTLDEMGWDLDKTGILIRNMLVAAVMSGIAFRYFFLQHQLRRQEQAELNSRIQALQSRIAPISSLTA